MSKFRVGIIGVGFIGTLKHLEGLKGNAELCEITAICDLLPERSEKARANFAPQASTTTDWHDIVNDPDIDVVYVCTWNVSHCEITCAALEAGKHVMCEKPMAISGEEARRMVETAQRTGKTLTIGYQNRFRQDTQFLRGAVDAGELGEIYVAKAHAVRRRGVPTWGVFTDKEKQGGGPLIDIGTHALDLALWYLGNYEVESVTGSVYSKLRDKPEGNPGGGWDPATFSVEDSAFGYVKMRNGATVFLEAAWALNVKNPREAAVTLIGTEGGAEIDRADGGGYDVSLNKVLANRMIVETPDASAPGSGDFTTLGTIETRQFLEAVRDGHAPLVLPEQACVVTEVLEAIYASAASGETIRF
ncbi:MAG: Gfo/Idh/MocA family oxidoreductase [Propionicimonas sp.]|uniref:Gfo/Idh/MocA family protein n=1 Tax=Propionicimonas sp. TaxID=1955623 RepID=UPI003D13987C